MTKKITQLEFVREWFKGNQGRFISHSESKPELEKGWFELTGLRFEDPDRAIRRLHQENQLVQKRDEKGMYAWNSSYVESHETPEFSDFLKETILARDGYACQKCEDPKDNDKLFVGFVTPVSKGGQAIKSNGITLCSHHALVLELSRDKKLAGEIFRTLTEKIYSESSGIDFRSEFWGHLLTSLYAEGKSKPQDFEKHINFVNRRK